MESFKMESFKLDKLKDLLPKELPKLPTWPTSHRSFNPDDEVDDDDFEHDRRRPPVTLHDATADIPRIEIVEPEPLPAGPRSYIDLINECDNFPYYQIDTGLFFAHLNTYYGLYVAEYPTIELGYILPSVAEVFRGLPDWDVNEDDRTLILKSGRTEAERSRIVAATCEAMRATGHFKVLNGWRNELYPVYGPKKDLLFNIERAASALFGIVTYGCHMTAYTKDDTNEMRIWVPRRAKTKSTYGGMLDNTVAGGIATGEKPFESLVREAGEEASLPEDIVRKHAKSVGTVSYFHIRDRRAGGETRLLQPECQYVYDLELPANVKPEPSDDEVESFELKTVDEVKQAMRDGEFKPNCAIVMIDFFVRHGIITAEDDNYIDIVSRLHRKFEFPTI